MRNSALARLTAALVAALLTAQVAFLVFAQVTLADKPATTDGELIPGLRLEAPRSARKVVLHEEARIFLYENLLSEEECDHIINLAAPHVQPSGVLNSATGRLELSQSRVSHGTWLRRGHDEVVADIEHRIAHESLFPAGNQEPMQVLLYKGEENGKYDGHYDAFFDQQSMENGGNRVATMLLFLSDVEEGGETVFPNLPAPAGDNGPEFSECARHSLAVKPRKGSALLFHNVQPSGELERRSFHTSCPVTKGVKWSAPKWIHGAHWVDPIAEQQQQQGQQGQQQQQQPGQPQECADKHDLCGAWATSGECLRNPFYMIGTQQEPGACLKSCNRCDILAFNPAAAQEVTASTARRQLLGEPIGRLSRRML
ncbi:hypothetical protein N2152v2_005461 [Parachlorella kessleri]